MQTEYKGIRFDDSDVVNADDWHEDGPGAFLLHDHGFTLAVVIAETLQDALDEAADCGKLESFKIEESELGDYPESKYGERPGAESLGNSGVLYAVESIDILMLPNPPMSWVALFSAMQAEGTK